MDILNLLDFERLERLRAYSALMRDWNAKINLVSRKDIDSFEEHHLLPCVALAYVFAYSHDNVSPLSCSPDCDKFLEENVLLNDQAVLQGKLNALSCNLLDVGTGGGLPGIPLAICFPNAKFTLIDSIGKKITAVQDMINQLGLKNVTAYQSRVETVNEKFDFVVARAVTALPDFWKLIRKNLKPSGALYYLKGGDFSQDLARFKKNSYQIYNLPILDKKVVKIFPSPACSKSEGF